MREIGSKIKLFFLQKSQDDQDLHFENKLFLKSKTRSLFHIPLNMGSVFAKTFTAMEKADAMDMDDLIVLSYDPSLWTGEHFFAVRKEVPGQENVRLNGDYLTKVFEGPYKSVPKFEKEMVKFVESKGRKVKKTYFFYTTCPKCMKHYGENYMVAVSEVE